MILNNTNNNYLEKYSFITLFIRCYAIYTYCFNTSTECAFHNFWFRLTQISLHIYMSLPLSSNPPPLLILFWKPVHHYFSFFFFSQSKKINQNNVVTYSHLFLAVQGSFHSAFLLINLTALANHFCNKILIGLNYVHTLDANWLHDSYYKYPS